VNDPAFINMTPYDDFDCFMCVKLLHTRTVVKVHPLQLKYYTKANALHVKTEL
jgi:hypothetical protein